MRSRGLVVALALLLAVGATVAVFLYVNGVRKDALGGGGATQVIVATQDIPANTDLNPLIDQGGVFVPKTIPTDALVAQAVTTLDELRDQTTTVPILANEQIPTSRLSGGTATNVLGICADCVALSMRVDGPPGVAGHVQRGDEITLYATFEGLQVFSSTRNLLTALQGKGGPGPSAQPQQLASFPPFTMTVLPQVKVLAVENPVVDAQGRTSNGSVTLTLDVPKTDAEFVIHSIDKGSLYIGLLPPNGAGIQLPAESIDINKFLGKKS